MWPAANSDQGVPLMTIYVQSSAAPEKHRQRYKFLESLNR
jgi:hypothetical protein